MKRIDQEVSNTNASITKLNRQIDDESRRMETHTREKRDEARVKLDQAQIDVDKNHTQLKAVEARIATEEEQRTGAANEGQQLDARLRDAEKEVRDCSEQIRLCDARAQNNLAPYGERIGEVMAQVKRMTWHGGIPVGPLGLNVKLKDSKWAETMRIQLGGLMTAWAVTDARDRQQLKTLLTKSGKFVVRYTVPPRSELTHAAIVRKSRSSSPKSIYSTFLAVNRIPSISPLCVSLTYVRPLFS